MSRKANGSTSGHGSSTAQAERRRHPRSEPAQRIGVRRAPNVIPVSDARVLNTSRQGIAIRTAVPVHAGERLSFVLSAGTPPVLAEVLACETMDGGAFRVRCRCLLGGFDDVM